ncbi:MAG: GGDEF domain-containing protein [Pseudolabrys sp.]
MDAKTPGHSTYRLSLPGDDRQPPLVTRWTARLADPQIEQDYRVERFADDRRRAFVLMGLASGAGCLNFLVQLHSYRAGTSAFDALLPPFVAIWLPWLGIAIVRRLRSPFSLEYTLILAIVVATIMRLAMVTLHPVMAAMWPTLLVGMVFVIYLYLPVRFVAAVVLACAFSAVGWGWWAVLQAGQQPIEHAGRAAVWLLFANALGFIAANSLQRSQRVQYAQSLMLKELLSTDSLTGIGNRRRFDDALDREWRRCGRSGKPLSLLMIDVDHFKAYNDHCGHLQGDECLRRVALLLVGSVGRPGDLVARYGGEEFVCLLPETGAEGARAVADKCVRVLDEAAIVHPALGLHGRLSISIGVATAEELGGRASGSLVALADKLLYEAKAAGRARVMAGAL